MKNWRRVISIILIVLLQVSVVSNVKFNNSMLNLPMIFLIIFLVRKDDYTAIWWVALGGLIMDIYSSQFFGYFSLQYLFIFLVYRSAIRPILHDPELPVVAVIYLGLNFLIFIFDAMISKLNPFSEAASLIIYQSVAGVLIYLLYCKITKRSKLLLHI